MNMGYVPNSYYSHGNYTRSEDTNFNLHREHD